MLRSITAACLAAFVGFAAHAEPLRVVTAASSSPFSRGADLDLPGFAHEYVELMAAHAGIEVSVEYFPWKRAQKMAQEDSDGIMIFNLTRTEAREPVYDWVTRLLTVDWTFLTTDEAVNDLDAAQGLERIGSRSVYKRYLEGEGLQNVEESDTLNNFKKLKAGRVSAVFTNSQRGRFIWVEELGQDPADLHIGSSLRQGDIWLGATPGYDAEIIQKFEAANQALQADGTYAKLYAKYFGDLEVVPPARPDQKPTGTGS
ncbi:MAG: hypothetical protein BM562_01070 [Alphaproteobacteria bacterium MedPE-SWcel]|nr:MAG: hypothetical protein BM562_01070 [Alphaproteobacteria bacterium MedPE-SWcel]